MKEYARKNKLFLIILVVLHFILVAFVIGVKVNLENHTYTKPLKEIPIICDPSPGWLGDDDFSLLPPRINKEKITGKPNYDLEIEGENASDLLADAEQM